MKAMVLAAGLGTRLRPLTDHTPKALVEIAGRTLLEITLTRLKKFGVTDVIINVHHLADKIVDYLKAHENFGLHVAISREGVLLDTGGGLKKAAWFFLQEHESGGPFLLHNVDVISAIDLREMLKTHESKKALATLAVQQRDASRQLLFDDDLKLRGRRAGRDATPEIVRSASNIQALAFTGIHVISPRLLPMMSEYGVFSIIETYLRLAKQGETIQGYRADVAYWRDLGKLEQLKEAEADYRQGLFS